MLGSGGVDANAGAITHWKEPWLQISSLKGVQQRLQILGYYTGKVDGLMGEKSERAILEFQADEGTLLIDGVAGPKTQKALDAFFQKHGKDASGKNCLIRRYLLRFERARTGDTSADCPHPDYRAGDLTVVPYGFKKSSPADRDRNVGDAFNLGLDADAFMPGTDLILVPKFKNKSDFAFVSLQTPDASYQAANRYDKPYLRMIPRVQDGEDVLNLHLDRENGPVVGAVRVKIGGMKQVKTTVHLVTIADAKGKTVPPWTQKEALDLLGMINAVWMPMGVEFQVARVQSNNFTGLTAGTVTQDYSGKKGGRIEYLDLWSKFNVANSINIYFCERLIDLNLENGKVGEDSNTLGFALPRKAWKSTVNPNGPIGCCVRRDADFFNLALTVAHELGHVLNLTCHKDAHSDDDGTPTPFRHDIWSRTRLMSKYSGYFLDDPPRGWQKSTYGTTSDNALQHGAWLTVKRLKNDGTDDEMEISRKVASNTRANPLY